MSSTALRCRLLPVATLVLCAALAGPGGAQQNPESANATALLKTYCLGCHSAAAKQGGLVLENLDPAAPSAHAEVWEKVVRRMRARSMPPAGLPRPKDAAYVSLIDQLTSALDAHAAAKPNPGRTDTFRRLNRTEYRNAIRDLLAVDLDVSSLVPADESSLGFDNITVGDLTPTQLERYLSAAQKISRLAVGITGRSPGGETITLPPDLTQEDHFEGMPLGTRGGARFHYNFPADAEYDIVIRLARDRNEHVEGLYEPTEVELLLDGERVEIFTVNPLPRFQRDHSVIDRHLRLRHPVKAGPRTIAVTFPKLPTALLETERQPYPAHFNMDRHPRVHPAVYSVSVNGPYNAKGPGDTPSRRLLFVCKPANPADEPACASKILLNIARRAYRRPVTPEDVKAPLRFFSEARKDGDFDHGIEMALRSILVSPEFLFRVESAPPGTPANSNYRISDLELASRLSFFLWSSIPDEALLNDAAAGKLKDPQVLERHTRRMLADPRASTLVNNFAEQWLHLRNLASASPDMRLFADFDDNLRQSFKRETELFFESILREDRSVLDLLQANYSFLNERLAKHYGVRGVYGSRFRKVTFDDETPRGGLLRQGSILTVTSYATRTSPVIRGKWILENILGTPPPPPPAVVAALVEKSPAGKELNMRQRLARHRDDPACSGCHKLMDPVGFSLENYDAVGRWRTIETGTPVDASGGLPDGSKFSGPEGLQKAILQRPELFATTITEKLLTYALGRGVEHFDAPSVRKVVRQAHANNYRLSSFIVGVVNSTPFQLRRSL